MNSCFVILKSEIKKGDFKSDTLFTFKGFEEPDKAMNYIDDQYKYIKDYTNEEWTFDEDCIYKFVFFEEKCVRFKIIEMPIK